MASETREGQSGHIYRFKQFTEQPPPPKHWGSWYEVGWYFAYNPKSGNLKRIFYHNRREPPRPTATTISIGPYRTYSDAKLAATNFARSCPVVLFRANMHSLKVNPNLNLPRRFRVPVSPLPYCRDPKGRWDRFTPTSPVISNTARPYNPKAIRQRRQTLKSPEA